MQALVWLLSLTYAISLNGYPESGSISKDIWFPVVRSRIVMMAWRGPQSANGNKNEYQIVAKDTKTIKCLTFTPMKTSALLYILEPDTTYLITVSADGQDSNEFDVDVQAEATGADSIRVTWTPPKVYKTDNIRAYSLYLWGSPVDLNDYAKPIATGFAEQNVTAHTFKSLSPFTTYTVMIKLVLSDDSKPSDFGLASATTGQSVIMECLTVCFLLTIVENAPGPQLIDS
nr:unnamed protein product [Spirometra erinaceieuropaei]